VNALIHQMELIFQQQYSSNDFAKT
jgi:hypothetical protein